MNAYIKDKANHIQNFRHGRRITIKNFGPSRKRARSSIETSENDESIMDGRRREEGR